MNPQNYGGSPYVSQYVGLPLDAFVQSATALQQGYDTNVAKMDQYDMLSHNLDLLSADAGVKNALIKATKDAHAEIAQTGAYEHAGDRVRMLTKRFLEDPQLKAAEGNKKRATALQEEFKDKGLHQQFKLQKALANYKGIGTPDENGAYGQFGAGLTSYKDQDIGEKTDKLLKDWKATKTSTQNSDGKWMYTIDGESVPEDQLRTYATKYLLNDPAIQTQLIDETRYANRNSELSGTELQEALGKHLENYVEPIVQKYGYTNSTVKKDIDPWGKLASEQAFSRSQQQAGFNHADAAQARGFAHAEKMKQLDNVSGFTAAFPGGVVNMKAMLPDSESDFNTQKTATAATVTKLQNLIGGSANEEDKRILSKQLYAAQQKQQVLDNMQKSYLESQYKNPKERTIMAALAQAVTTTQTTVEGDGMTAPSSIPFESVNKQKARKLLEAKGISPTDAELDGYLTKYRKSQDGFSNYLKTKRDSYTVQPAMDAIPFKNDDDRKLFSTQMQTSGNYSIQDESGAPVNIQDRKFTIHTMSRGNIGGLGVVYGATLEPTAEEKSKHPEMTAKTVTIVPSLDDENASRIASYRLRLNPKDEWARSISRSEFGADVAAISNPHSTAEVDVKRSFTTRKGETRQLYMGKIRRVGVDPTDPGNPIAHYEYELKDVSTPGKNKILRANTDAELQEVLQREYELTLKSLDAR